METTDLYLFLSTHVTVPPWATVIYHAAFRLHIMLKIVELPNGLEVIEDYAFEECKKLTESYYLRGLYLLALEHLRVVHHFLIASQSLPQ